MRITQRDLLDVWDAGTAKEVVLNATIRPLIRQCRGAYDAQVRCDSWAADGSSTLYEVTLLGKWTPHGTPVLGRRWVTIYARDVQRVLKRVPA
jgi:hypothetical protein